MDRSSPADDGGGNSDLVTALVEIINGTPEQARQFLQATNWQLEDAIQLYFAEGNEIGGAASVSSPPVANGPVQYPSIPPEPNEDKPTIAEDDYVRPPLPVKREALYEDPFQYRAHRMAQTANKPSSVDAFRNFEEEANERARSSDKNAGSSGGGKDTLAALYRPPFDLMFQGNFEQAKAEAAKQAKWLLLNVQSTKEFGSYMLNRDTWAHEAVKETVGTTFVFWQVYDDTEEGSKVCTYYKLLTLPTILILDPLTGQKMRSWEGMISAEGLLEDLVPFMDRGPMERQPSCNPPQKRPRESTGFVDNTLKGDVDEDDELQRALAASLEDNSLISSASDNKVEIKDMPDLAIKKETKTAECLKFPPLPEEPAAGAALVCRVGIRFPDGGRGQRRFFLSDPIKYLWSFCATQVKEASGRSFHLLRVIPGVTDSLDYNSNLTIGEASVANSMLAMAWD